MKESQLPKYSWRHTGKWHTNAPILAAAFSFGLGAHLGREIIVLELMSDGHGYTNPARIYAMRDQSGQLTLASGPLLEQRNRHT